ncbi:intein-containing Rv2578c family radical SAM protein [Pseudonocardia sp. C8]|uniref:intein-containing Rv2578c family radical SAM protein n=1 Tax=Pseudonocardia sp. C8 TaxID=2762759 RepID=UPI0016425B32|nr:intein-containing Rv2578c family radical SAM protein [Pseudonocardia sp. C8]MBC3192598.1 intein-containing Rv2578c family radical SAM protein [Pseudonocardia sp. C8]
MGVRWSGQQVGLDGIGTDAALPGMRGLLRSVRTPEFAGTVFHEVEARSVLNRVPSSSPMPFGWTVNPYRGCSHACTYCLDGATPVLTADGRSRPIGELRAGDEVVGTVPDARGRRRFVRTPVLARWSTHRRAQRVVLDDGTLLVTSAEHRFLTRGGWAHVRPGRCRASADRPHLRPGSELAGPGAAAMPGRPRPDGYAQGYLCGLARADAVRGRVTAAPFPSAWVELEALARAHHLLTSRPVVAHGPDRAPRPAAGGVAAVAGERPSPAAWPDRPGPGWSAGFLGGVLDVCGEVSAGVLRVVPADEVLTRATVEALRRLGFRVASEPSGRPGGRALRVLGGAAEQLRLVAAADPAVARVRDVGGALVEEPPDGAPRVVDVEDTGEIVPMVDITTGTGDFVAAGVVSHNCFARNTHTYLDLDAGADFDSQIVVKVNVARVLERELARPGWRREHVAMGTNTDPYQRAEGRYRLMPGVISALARSGTPFSILTKGTVLTRDLPELAAANADVRVGTGVSIALLDRGLQARLEPGTPSPRARLDLVRRITDAGLPCGVMVAPVLPWLTDSEEALDAVLAEIAAAGATGATVLALHLRPGTREWFLQWLAREYPKLLPRYERLYRRGANADREYRTALHRRVVPLLARHGLDRRDPAAGDPASRKPVRDLGWTRQEEPPAVPDPRAGQLSLL